jgi:hypothetical protein
MKNAQKFVNSLRNADAKAYAGAFLNYKKGLCELPTPTNLTTQEAWALVNGIESFLRG